MSSVESFAVAKLQSDAAPCSVECEMAKSATLWESLANRISACLDRWWLALRGLFK